MNDDIKRCKTRRTPVAHKIHTHTDIRYQISPAFSFLTSSVPAVASNTEAAAAVTLLRHDNDIRIATTAAAV